MSYPRWISRQAEFQDLTAFEDHSGSLYASKSNQLYLVESWCETASGESQVTWSLAKELTGANTIRYIKSALDKLWIVDNTSLYKLDPANGDLDGPWTTTDVASINGLDFYDGDIYAIARGTEHLPALTKLLKFDVVAEIWSVIDASSPSGLADHLAIYDGVLYFTNYYNLRSWDGVAVSPVHTFASADRIGVLSNPYDSALYIGTGSSVGPAGTNADAKVWEYAGGESVNYILTIATGRTYYNQPRAIAWRSATEGYVFTSSYSENEIYKFDPVGLTSSLDDSAGGDNSYRSLFYWTSDDTVWGGERRTKIFVANLCSVARTYFFLA